MGCPLKIRVNVIGKSIPFINIDTITTLDVEKPFLEGFFVNSNENSNYQKGNRTPLVEFCTKKFGRWKIFLY